MIRAVRKMLDNPVRKIKAVLPDRNAMHDDKVILCVERAEAVGLK